MKRFSLLIPLALQLQLSKGVNQWQRKLAKIYFIKFRGQEKQQRRQQQLPIITPTQKRVLLKNDYHFLRVPRRRAPCGL